MHYAHLLTIALCVLDAHMQKDINGHRKREDPRKMEDAKKDIAIQNIWHVSVYNHTYFLLFYTGSANKKEADTITINSTEEIYHGQDAKEANKNKERQ